MSGVDTEVKAPFRWGALPTVTTPDVSLADVMSEELASELQKKEFVSLVDVPTNSTNNNKHTNTAIEATEEIFNTAVDEETSDDLLIAQMLQKQFDSEYDSALGKEEQHLNGSSKVRVCYSKYRMVPEHIVWDDSEEDEMEDEEWGTRRDIDRFETKEKELGQMPLCGYKKVGNKLVTKHDKEITQRENAKRIMEFPPGIQTGDGGGFDMQISNKVYNKIKNFSVKEGKRKNRLKDKEDEAVAEQAVDPKTRILLYKLVNGGVLDAVNGVISTGKEAVIMHADGGPGPEGGPEVALNVPKECAVKIFKTTLNEFKTRDKYIRDDYRFRDRFSKQNPRKIIHMWAEKEMHNLVKMAKGGLRVPEAVVLKKHVLIMSFIGAEGKPAPKLKEAADRMSVKDMESAYNQVVEMMTQLYNVCHLVHADLSEYNILWWEKECWLIDVSQAVEPIHPSGLDFLYRDCTNVYNFFSKHGVSSLSPRELFSQVSGLPTEEGSEAEVLCQIQQFQKTAAVTGMQCEGREGEPWEANQYAFDYCWERSLDPNSTPSRPIPGHKKTKPSAKSPRSPKSPRTPGSDFSKSPKTPGSDHAYSKSPVSDIVGLPDEELRKLKLTLLSSSPDKDIEVVLPKKPSQIKFSDSDFVTIGPSGNVVDEA